MSKPNSEKPSHAGAAPVAQAANGEGHEPGRGPDRRKSNVGGPSGLERRRGPGRRLSDFTKAAEEGELTSEQFLFVMAIEDFKRANNKQYPSWTDVIEVVRLLGYRKTMPSEIRVRSAEDWREAADAASNVRPANFERRFKKDLEALREEFGDGQGPSSGGQTRAA